MMLVSFPYAKGTVMMMVLLKIKMNRCPQFSTCWVIWMAGDSGCEKGKRCGLVVEPAPYLIFSVVSPPPGRGRRAPRSVEHIGENSLGHRIFRVGETGPFASPPSRCRQSRSEDSTKNFFAVSVYVFIHVRSRWVVEWCNE